MSTTAASRPALGRLVLPVICIAQFMVALDVAVVNIALPSIADAVSLTSSGLPWVVGAYTLSYGGLLLLGGRAADLFGRRRVFLGGIALFTFASLLCGIANSADVLIGARFTQGVGAALASPSALSLIAVLIPAPSRARAIGLYGAMSGLGLAAGELLGGVLTSSASWRWAFWVNVPVGVALLIAAPLVLGEYRGTRRNLPIPSALVGTAGMLCCVYATIRAGGHGWGNMTTVTTFVCAAVLLALFLCIDFRTKEPLLPQELFRDRERTGAYISTFLLYGGMYAVFFFVTVFDQNVLGYSPLRTGLAFLPVGITIMLATWLARRAVLRFGLRWLAVIGALLCCVCALLLTREGSDSRYINVQLPALLALGIGAGLATVANTLRGVHAIQPASAGVASGVLGTARQIGGTLGVAVLPSIAATVTTHVSAHEDTAQAATSGYTAGFAVAACMAIVAALSSWGIFAGRRRPASAV
ncbi:MFS transporter [Streptomyces canus]|uniref:MFS transporter n=1 Tax=Streptomyces canus TaxID=58343 RepID=UPI0033D4479E